MPQSERLRGEYLRLAQVLLEYERAEVRRSLGRSPGALRRHLEWIDRAREATRQIEEAAATPFPAASLADGIGALERADHLLQPSLDLIATKIDEAIARAGLRVPVETYTCALPTGMFNAQARQVPGGVLIIINTGLVSLLFGATQVIAHAATFDISDGLGRPLYTDAQVSAAFAGLLLAHVAFGDARESDWLAPQGGLRGQLAHTLWASTQIFAVAHEFAHVIGGHLDGRHAKLPKSAWQNVDVAAKSVEQEGEADTIASAIVSCLNGVDTDVTAPSMVAAGPAIFFALARSVDLARGQLLRAVPPSNADHPPPVERWARVRADLEQRLPVDSFVLADNVQQWIANATDHAVIALGQQETARD